MSDAAPSMRRRLAAGILPAAVAIVVLVALTAPTAYYVLGVQELERRAASAADRVASDMQRDVAGRPVLWKYDSIKVLAHARALQRDAGVAALEVVDAGGVPIAEPSPPHGAVIWARAPIHAGAEVVGEVWAAMSLGRLRARAALLAAGFAVLGLLLGGVVYLVPLRVVARAERRDARLRALSGRAAALQESERRAISRDLHDAAGQALTAIRINLQLIGESAGDGARTRELSEATVALTDEALEEVRRAVASLAPSILEDIGLEDAVRRLCADVAERASIDIEDAVDLGGAPLAPAVETAAYRIVQEALTNVVRHAGASAARVRLSHGDGQLRVEVSDDGRGFDPSASRGRGVTNMRERAELLGGSLAVDRGNDGGARVRAVLPLAAAGDGVESDHG